MVLSLTADMLCDLTKKPSPPTPPCALETGHHATEIASPRGLPPETKDHLSLADLGGRTRRVPPLRVQILSFWHAKFLKHSHLGGPRPPVRGPRPPYGKSWIRHCLWPLWLLYSLRKMSKIEDNNPNDNIVFLSFNCYACNVARFILHLHILIETMYSHYVLRKHRKDHYHLLTSWQLNVFWKKCHKISWKSQLIVRKFMLLIIDVCRKPMWSTRPVFRNRDNLCRVNLN